MNKTANVRSFLGKLFTAKNAARTAAGGGTFMGGVALRNQLQKAAPDTEHTNSVGEAMDFIGDRPMWFWAAAPLLALGTYGLTEKKMEEILKKKNLETSSEELDQLRNAMDKLVYDEYKRTRGISDSGTEPTSDGEHELQKGAQDGVKNTLSTLGAVYLLYAALTGVGSFGAAKKYAKHNSEAEKRYKKLQEIAKEQILQKSDETPMLLNPSSDPVLSTGMHAKEKQKGSVDISKANPVLSAQMAKVLDI